MSYIEENSYLTVKEVAAILKLSEITIYKYIREQKLDAFEFGRHFRISKSSLSKFIRAHKKLNTIRHLERKLSHE